MSATFAEIVEEQAELEQWALEHQDELQADVDPRPEPPQSEPVVTRTVKVPVDELAAFRARQDAEFRTANGITLTHKPPVRPLPPAAIERRMVAAARSPVVVPRPRASRARRVVRRIVRRRAGARAGPTDPSEPEPPALGGSHEDAPAPRLGGRVALRSTAEVLIGLRGLSRALSAVATRCNGGRGAGS